MSGPYIYVTLDLPDEGQISVRLDEFASVADSRVATATEYVNGSYIVTPGGNTARVLQTREEVLERMARAAAEYGDRGFAWGPGG